MAIKKGASGRLKRVLTGLVAGITALFIICLLRTLLLTHRTVHQPSCKSEDADFIAAGEELVDRFRHALRIQTISRNPGDYNTKELIELQRFIQKAYPVIHSSALVTREVIANYSLLYQIRGSDPKLKPYLLMGHLDVVPVADQIWDVPPFSSELKDGFIYARGALDDKHTVFGILEACEFMLKSGRQPRRTFFLAFGHDEEVGGRDGALQIANTLAQRGLHFEFIIDEGCTVLNGIVPTVKTPVGLLCTTEKGFLSLKLSVTVRGGHSSMPPSESSIGILANAVARLEANKQPSQFGYGPERAMFEHMSHNMPFPIRILMSNLWLFSPLVSWYLSRTPEGNALARTTTAITVFNAGTKENVLAPQATALVNHRVHPSQKMSDVIEFDKFIINDERVKIETVTIAEPHPISPYGDEDFGYQSIKSSIMQVWDYTGVTVVPGVLLANTDTRHYLQLSENIYRFSPTYMYPDDLKRFHGRNERLSVKNYEEAVNFFYHLMINADEPELEPLHQHGQEL